MIRTLIVDDEALARTNIRLRLEGELDVEIVGEAADGVSALRAIQKLSPDLMFLDVRMPRRCGFDILERLGTRPRLLVVFVTAYDQYAAKAFDTHAVDYLLKPISHSRFQEALRRVRSEMARLDGAREDLADDHGHVTEPLQRGGDHLSSPGPLRRLAVKVGDRFRLLKLEDVDWVESAANYVRLHVRDSAFLLRMTMDQLEEKLDDQQFTRIHRSRIVNTDRIIEISPTLNGDFDVLLRDQTTLRLSRVYRDRLLPR